MVMVMVIMGMGMMVMAMVMMIVMNAGKAMVMEMVIPGLAICAFPIGRVKSLSRTSASTSNSTPYRSSCSRNTTGSSLRIAVFKRPRASVASSDRRGDGDGDGDGNGSEDRDGDGDGDGGSDAHEIARTVIVIVIMTVMVMVLRWQIKHTW